LIHDKAGVVNYLPLITLGRALSEEAGVSLLRQEMVKVERAISEISGSLGVRTLVRIGVPPLEILQILEGPQGQQRIPDVPSLSTGAIARFRSQGEKLEQLRKASLRRVPDPEDLKRLVSERSKRDLLQRMVRNSVADLHFLPPAPFFFPNALVVQLRLVGTLSLELLQLAGSCQTQADWALVRKARTEPEFILSPSKPERLMRLRSPHLESLMFRFGVLFGRIGVRDLPHESEEEYIRLGAQ
jgi:hypothetical protein